MSSQLSNSIIKGASALKYLAAGITRITDLAGKLELSKSSTHRLLKSLETTRLVVQDPLSRQYFLGSLVFELTSHPLQAHQHLILSALEEMRRLSEVSGETVGLYVRIGIERICLEEMPAQQAIRHSVGKGRVLPVYAGSAGKILLSELTDSDRDLLLENLVLRRVEKNTITQRGELLRQLEKVRRDGYAMSFSEAVQGGASISVPIKGYVCPVALAVLGPDNRFSRDVMIQLLEEVRMTADRISKRLMGSSHTAGRET